MSNFSYAKWIAPAILFFFIMVCLGYWTHKIKHPAPAAPVAGAAQK